MLKTLEFQVDGNPSKDFPESFSEIVFFKSGKNLEDVSEKTFSFESYIVKPYAGFDFHDKFNKGIAQANTIIEQTRTNTIIEIADDLGLFCRYTHARDVIYRKNNYQ